MGVYLTGEPHSTPRQMRELTLLRCDWGYRETIGKIFTEKVELEVSLVGEVMVKAAFPAHFGLIFVFVF